MAIDDTTNVVSNLSGEVGPDRDPGVLTAQVMPAHDSTTGGVTLYIDHQFGNQELVVEIVLSGYQARRLARLLGKVA